MTLEDAISGIETPLRRDLARYLAAMAPAGGATKADMMSFLYGDDPEGGPRQGDNSVATHVSAIRRDLQGSGFSLERTQTRPYRYGLLAAGDAFPDPLDGTVEGALSIQPRDVLVALRKRPLTARQAYQIMTGGTRTSQCWRAHVNVTIWKIRKAIEAVGAPIAVVTEMYRLDDVARYRLVEREQ